MIKFLRFIPVQLTFFLIIGILLGNYINFQPIYLAGIGIILCIIFGFVYNYSNKKFQPSIPFLVVVCLTSLLIGISAITFKNQLNNSLHYSNAIEFNEELPLTTFIQIKKVLKGNTYYNKYEAAVLELNNIRTTGKILVNIQKDSSLNSLKVDAQLVVKTAFKKIEGSKNPNGFNYRKYLQNQQIYHQVHIYKNHFLTLQNTSKTITGVAANFRDTINKKLKRNGFKDDELAVVNALLLGQRQDISEELLQSYVGAGAVHILAVSGLHIGIILLILTFVFKPLHHFKNGKFLAVLVIILLLWVYAVIAGLSASVVRAVTMFTALSIGMHLNKPSNVYNNLFISMFFLLLFNPFYLFEVGFQLSYLAVFSIVWIQPKMYNLWKPKFLFPDKIWQLFTVSIAAQIGVLPLSLYYFHQFPGLFFLSNLVIIPFLGIILSVGIVVIFLSLFDILPHLLGDLYSYIIQKMNFFVGWISNQDEFIIQNISFSFFVTITSYLFILFSIKWFEKRTIYRLGFMLISIILIQFVIVSEKYKLESTNELIVFNKTKSSVIGKRKGKLLELIISKDSISQDDFTIKSYLMALGVQNNLKIVENKKLYFHNSETILVVDSLGLYTFNTIKPTIILLQQSPKINLERLLKILQPKLIIADASNYKKDVENWENTCLKNKTPFHSTMQKGAYIFK